MTPFATIRARAERRKGGAEALAALLPPPPDPQKLRTLGDDRILAEMTKRVFSAGFVWSVIEAKWPGFEEVFLDFVPSVLVFQPDEFWETAMRDGRIVRNGAKIRAVRANARFVAEVARDHGGFGAFLAERPSRDQAELLSFLAEKGERLGGMTGQMFLRFVGWDGYVTSKDVVACLRDAGAEIADEVKSKRDLRVVQACFDRWHEETGLSHAQMSRICAMSIGENGAEAPH